MARVSVIVTSYNIEGYLEECLDGILAQTLEDLEIIVVDDGSTDGSPDIIRAVAERDDRVVPILLEENTIGGVATAANVGLDRATSEWVGFADGDDVYDPTMFAKLLTAAEAGDADLAMCQYLLLDDSDGVRTPPPDHDRWDHFAPRTYHLDGPTTRRVLRFVAVPWRKLYRRSLLEDRGLRFPVGDYFYEDNPFHWSTVLSADSVAMVPEILCEHRVARAGQTMATVDARLFKIFQHHDTILAWLEEHDLAEEYRVLLLAWAMSQMEWICRRTPKELHRELFDTLAEVLAHHDDDTVRMALAEKGNPKFAGTVTSAVRADNFAAFTRALDHPGQQPSALVSAAYHLRHSGVRRTARVGVRWAANQLRRSRRRISRRSSLGGSSTVEISGRSAKDVTNRDLILSMMVIQQRLDQIQEQLDDLAAADRD